MENNESALDHGRKMCLCGARRGRIEINISHLRLFALLQPTFLNASFCSRPSQAGGARRGVSHFVARNAITMRAKSN